ncbi:MAG: hypothetical protein JXQ72_05250 [Anaerolineae bacterium]|nr:hypothetical protein [Anaerolineae bacterium]
MMRRWSGLALVIMIISGALAGLGSAVIQAQGDPDGVTDYQLNLRAGPGVDYAVLAVLPAGTGLVFEARSEDMAWLLGHTLDGTLRGWVAPLYLSYRDGFTGISLPVSADVIAAPPPQTVPGDGSAGAASPAPQVIPAGPVADMPLISVGTQSAIIFARGQRLGNNARVFTQIGECNTRSQAFMVPLGSGEADLGPYEDLQPTIDFFAMTPVGGAPNSFWYKGMAMTTGLTSLAAIDPAYADPSLCGVDQSLVACEYERVRPAIAFIHLGLYDVYWLIPGQYEYAMRQIIELSIQQGVIPVLTTFPTCGGDEANWPNEAVVRNTNREAFNTTLVNLARSYGVPLINLWRATQSLPNCGLLPGDYQHLSGEGDRALWASFNGAEQQYGFTAWNLLALQMLDALRIEALEG